MTGLAKLGFSIEASPVLLYLIYLGVLQMLCLQLCYHDIK